MPFPSLIASSVRTWSPGTYPIAPTVAGTGTESRALADTGINDSRLRLTFIGLPESDMLAIEAHVEEVGIGWQPFSLPASCWDGVSNSAHYLPAGYGWIYAEPPDVEDYSCGGHTVTVSLEARPFGGVVAPGGDLTVWVSIATEAPVYARGATMVVELLLTAGSGEPKPSSQGAGAALSVAVSLAAGGANTGTLSALLMHFNGENNSTLFTDSSSNNFTITRNIGDARITTAQSKFGGASGYFDGSSCLSCPTDSGKFSFGSADFTIESFVRVSTLAGIKTICSVFPQSFVPSWRFIIVGNAIHFHYETTAGDYNQVASSGCISVDTWHYVAMHRNGSTINLSCDGTIVGSASISGTIRPATSALQIGRNEQSDTWYMNGYIDELRITPGEARALTPPSSQFPDY